MSIKNAIEEIKKNEAQFIAFQRMLRLASDAEVGQIVRKILTTED